MFIPVRYVNKNTWILDGQRRKKAEIGITANELEETIHQFEKVAELTGQESPLLGQYLIVQAEMQNAASAIINEKESDTIPKQNDNVINIDNWRQGDN